MIFWGLKYHVNNHKPPQIHHLMRKLKIFKLLGTLSSTNGISLPNIKAYNIKVLFIYQKMQKRAKNKNLAMSTLAWNCPPAAP